jgi:hypothetical protein
MSVSVKSCIFYCFAYVRKSPRSAADLPASIGHHLDLAKAFAHKNGYEGLGKPFVAWRTNRHRHFADVPEFKEAVRIASELGGHVIIGNLAELLVATHPDMILDAMAEVEKAGDIIINATTGEAVTPTWKKKMLSAAKAAASARRLPIARGMALSEPKKIAATAINTRKASRGAAQAADRFARLIKPEVDRVKAELPPNAVLTPMTLARALNKQSVSTARGGDWTAPSARNLLARLQVLFPDQSTGESGAS